MRLGGPVTTTGFTTCSTSRTQFREPDSPERRAPRRHADGLRWRSVKANVTLAALFAGRPRTSITSIVVAFLVASLVSFLVFVFFEASLLGVVPVMRMVILAFAHTLLVFFVFRIVLFVVLKKWSCHSLYPCLH